MSITILSPETRQEFRDMQITVAMNRTWGNKTEAVSLLGLGIRTLDRDIARRKGKDNY